VIVRPLAVDGTVISIRKFSKRGISLDHMAANANTSPSLSELLKVVARCRLNILISGGTGSGKTTLLNAISEHIDHEERIVTIEDAAELKLQQPHVVRLETRPVRADKREDEVTIRDLMKNALRMRPDRILVGEVRGAEAFDMMQAMNTGHEGSITTIHANHPRDSLARLENMINMANLNLPHQAIRTQIASAIHLVIQVSRMRDGHRRVTFVSEVVGTEGDVITMQDLFTFQNKGEGPDGKLIGDFKWTGIMPRFLRRVAYYGEADRLSAALGSKLPKV
jgi:pilus assembly protein CpaF